MNDESRWQRQVLIGLVMLLVVGVLIGAIVAFAGIKVANLAGINDDPSTTTSTGRLHVPRNAQTPTSPGAATTGPTAPTGPASSAPPTTRATHPPPDAITLTLSPKSVAQYGTITMTGTYHAPDGTTLQVQRREAGHWAAFPVTTSVSGAQFSTTVQTGQFGINRFRVTDNTTGVSSKPALVTVL